MQMSQRSLCLILLLLLFTLLGARCSDPDLQTVAKALRDTSQAVSVFQITLIDANAKGLVSENTTRQLMLVSVKANTAGLDADNITRNLDKLEPADRGNLLNILKPVITELQSATSVLATITNETARTNIAAALATIQTLLNTVQLTLAVKS